MERTNEMQDEIGLLFDRAEFEVFVELGGGTPAGEDRAAAIAALDATGVLHAAENGLVVDESLQEVARIVARPETVLDVHLRVGPEDSRTSYALTGFGGVRLVRAAESVVLTPFMTEQLLLRLQLELGLSVHDGTPGEVIELPSAAFGAALASCMSDDAGEAALHLESAGVDSDAAASLIGTLSSQRYTATAMSPNGAVTWVAGQDGALWVVPMELDDDPGATCVIRPVSAAQLLGGIGKLVQSEIQADHMFLPVPDQSGAVESTSVTEEVQ